MVLIIREDLILVAKVFNQVGDFFYDWINVELNSNDKIKGHYIKVILGCKKIKDVLECTCYYLDIYDR